MKLIAGLGNPGQEYENTRHNIGFMAADELRAAYPGFSGWSNKFQALVSTGDLGESAPGHRVILAKPQTFMNDSGRAVQEIAKFYKLEPNDIIIIYDDLDLPPNKVRYKRGGGDGGHRGVRSVAQHVGPDFHRLKVGIGRPPQRGAVLDYVLGKFTEAETPPLRSVMEAFRAAAGLLGEAAQSGSADDFAKFVRETAAAVPS